MKKKSNYLEIKILALLVSYAVASVAAGAEPYKLVNDAKVGGEGGFDYVFADSVGRKLYVPRSAGDNSRVTVFDLDSLQSIGEILNTPGIHGVAIDSQTGHGFTSSKPVVMFDTKTLQTIKSIDVEGNPDAILFEPFKQHIFVLSHRAPNVTVINSTDGNIIGTIDDLGGAPEQAVSDGTGRVYIDLEDKDEVAVVDADTLKVITHYDLAGKGGGPAGLAMDVKNRILFACCRKPQNAVVLNADNGNIITTLPIGSGVDGAVFNPATMEAFSSQRDGTLTVIKENSPTDFEVVQNVETKPGAKTCTLDNQKNQIFLITADPAPADQTPGATQGGRGRRWLPDSFQILVVGK
jgi:DNA-binding beta-propeller fold protein YncE